VLAKQAAKNSISLLGLKKIISILGYLMRVDHWFIICILLLEREIEKKTKKAKMKKYLDFSLSINLASY